jgi:hypothetical protein
MISEDETEILHRSGKMALLFQILDLAEVRRLDFLLRPD